MSESERPGTRKAALKGRIGPVSVAGLFHLLAQEKATGRFELTDGRQELAIWFLRGRPVHGRCPGGAEALDELLLQSGTLSECQLAGARLRRLIDPQKRLLDVLLEAGILDPACLGRLLAEQASGVVQAALACRSGRFRFEDGCLPEPEGVLREVGLEVLLLGPAAASPGAAAAAAPPVQDAGGPAADPALPGA